MSDEQSFSLAEYRKQREAGEVTPTEEVTGQAEAAAETPQESAVEPEESASEEREEEAEPAVEEKPKKGDRLQKRFDQLTSKIKDLEAQLATKSEPKQAEPMVKPASEAKPKLEDFETLEDFQEALTDWKLDQREKLAEQKRAESEAEKTQAERASNFKSRIEAAQAKYDDFDEVVLENPVQPSAAMVEAMLEEDLGAEIAYHLGQNPTEIKRIAALSPAKQAVEIGKLAAKLEPKEAAKTTPKPKAPPPPRPLGGKAAPSLKPVEEMSYQEYRAARLAGKIK